MPDLETQLRSLADHRAAQIPERPAEIEVPFDEPSSGWRRAPFLAAAGFLLLVGVAVTWWQVSREPDTVLTIEPPDGPLADPAPLAMADRDLVERDDWTSPLDQLDAPSTFVLASVNKVEPIQAGNADRADDRFRPASTYKLLNALLFLETGVADGLDDEIEWDGVDRGIDSWNRTHTLASALEVSAVWVFEELAGRIDAQTTSDLVADVGYGNADVGDAAGPYWLEGDLRISAVEQLAFLEDLYWARLPLSEQHQRDLVSAMTTEQVGGTTIRYKTGTALAGPEPVVWLVGIVETANQGAFVFAFNAELQLIDGEPQPLRSDDRFRRHDDREARERLGIVVELLTAAGLIN